MLAIALVVPPIHDVLPFDPGSGQVQHKDVEPTVAIRAACSALFGPRSFDCACQVLQLQFEWLGETDPEGAVAGYGGPVQGLSPWGHHCEDGHLMSLSL